MMGFLKKAEKILEKEYLIQLSKDMQKLFDCLLFPSLDVPDTFQGFRFKEE